VYTFGFRTPPCIRVCGRVETASGAEGAGAEDPGVPAASGEPADATATVPEKICLDVGAGVDDAGSIGADTIRLWCLHLRTRNRCTATSPPGDRIERRRWMLRVDAGLDAGSRSWWMKPRVVTGFEDRRVRRTK
jgi:hypothetical protein